MTPSRQPRARRTRAGRTGLLVVSALLLLAAVVADLGRDGSLIRDVLGIGASESAGEGMLRSIPGGLGRDGRSGR